MRRVGGWSLIALIVVLDVVALVQPDSANPTTAEDSAGAACRALDAAWDSASEVEFSSGEWMQVEAGERFARTAAHQDARYVEIADSLALAVSNKRSSVGELFLVPMMNVLDQCHHLHLLP